MTGLSIAKSLELLLVEPTVTGDDVDAACVHARDLHLAAVCVAPVNVQRAVSALAGTATQVCCVISFPAGHDRVETKLFAVDLARQDGAHRITIALDHAALAAGDVGRVRAEVRAILAHERRAELGAGGGDPYLTVAFETMQHDLERLQLLLDEMHDTGIGFVQVSTGWSGHAITDEHVRRLRDALPDDVGIKAVGGVSTLEDAVGLVNAGAVRVVTGSAIAIALEERRERSESGVL
jgi:deoxyribose-phosphate aldolase